ncbi:hypothetical protein [Micromonospora sp. NPDC005203]|uniref:hypothetical protein n=1 Tax=Micromonospora sp. NPDC005203 TaxID=3364226 RepID=UPI0036AAD307
MRGRLLVGVVLTLTFVGGCTSPFDRVGGDAAPAGSPSASVSPTPSDPASTTPSPTAPASPTPATRTTGPAKPLSEIRRTDWPNAVIGNLKFCGGSDDTVRFRNGSNGAPVPCRILPGGARPVYAEFVVEEPANAPSTEDALILVELGDPGSRRAQALVPVQLSYNGKERNAWPYIVGDSDGPDEIETFISYRVVDQDVQATVRKLDGSTEKRQWRKADGGGRWERTTVE